MTRSILGVVVLFVAGAWCALFDEWGKREGRGPYDGE